MGDVSYGAANRKLLLIHHSTVSNRPPELVMGPSACKQKIHPIISPTEYKPFPSSDYMPLSYLDLL